MRLLFLLLLSGCWISKEAHEARLEDFDADHDDHVAISAGGTDCDDANANVYPGAPERCNDVDDDCDGEVDDAPTDTETYFADTDGDGFGDPLVTRDACSQPADFVADAADCDDDAALVNPDQNEICGNEIDDDCDQEVDEVEPLTWYEDADGDTWGNDAVTVEDCAQPPGYVDRGGDCDDNAVNGALYHPNAPEVCGGNFNCDAVVAPACADCQELFDAAAVETDGYYTIDPDGEGAGEEPFEAYCDMDPDADEGWTLCFAYDTSTYDVDHWTANPLDPFAGEARDKLLSTSWGTTALHGDDATQGNFCNLFENTDGRHIRAEVVRVSNSSVFTSGVYALQEDGFFSQVHDDATRTFDCLVDTTGTKRLLFANYLAPAATQNDHALPQCFGQPGIHQTRTALETGDLDPTPGLLQRGTDGFLIMSDENPGEGNASDLSKQLSLQVNAYEEEDAGILACTTGRTPLKLGVVASWEANGRSCGDIGPFHCHDSCDGTGSCGGGCGATNVTDAMFKQRIWIR